MAIVWIYFPSSLHSKWAPASMRTGVSIMILSRTLDSWWTIAHNISLFFFFFFSLQSSSQQEIYWAANLWSSNWLRKNLNEFLNIQLKSIVTVFILGPRQIEIETINGNTSFWKNESLQPHSEHHVHTLTYTLMCTHIHTFIKFYIQEECMTVYIFGILKSLAFWDPWLQQSRRTFNSIEGNIEDCWQ